MGREKWIEGRIRNMSRNQEKKKRKKGRGGGAISTAVLLAAVCVFIFSAYQLTMVLVPYYTGGKEYDKVKELAIEQTDGNGEDGDNFKVDFEALLKENPDTVGWLRLEEPSVISYPIVKSSDNEEYLTKTFSANDNRLGAIFMDMRNNPEFTERNTFIYGHNLKVGGEMFSQLNEYASEEFCKKYPYFYIYTPNGQKLTYRVFSAAVVKDTAENYKITYATQEEFLDYEELCKATSNYQVDVELNSQSQIVSLSTCTNINDDERFLVQGVLVKEP